MRRHLLSDRYQELPLIAQADLKCVILLPHPSLCWNYKCGPACLASQEFLSVQILPRKPMIL